jgi:cytochrome c biogenesis protein CcdA
MPEIGGLALSYAAGALSTLSPCVLPLLPIILFGALEQHAWGPVALAAGLSAAFASVGIFLASFGLSLGIDPSTFRLGVAALMLSVGIVLLTPALQTRFALVAVPVAVSGQVLVNRLQPSGIGGQFVLGVLLGAIWSPCSGPTLGAAIGPRRDGYL